MARNWLVLGLITALLWAIWAESRARHQWQRGERYLRLLKEAVRRE